MFDAIASELQRTQAISTLEEVLIYLRGINVQLAGLYAGAPEGSSSQLDLGATLVHARDVMNWLDVKLQAITAMPKPAEPTPENPATDSTIH